MSPRKYPEEEHFVAPGKIVQHVSLAAAEGVSLGLRGMEAWQRASVKRTPVKIYDLNGKLLFLDYSIARGGEVIGTVRAAASKVLGLPIFAHELGPRSWNFNAAVEKLTPKVKKEHPKWTLVDTKLICYSYPKLGVLFSLKDEAGKEQRLIFDIADLSLIPEGTPTNGNEGAYAWSFYDSLSDTERRRRLRNFDQADSNIMQLSENVKSLLQQDSISKISVAVGGLLTLIKTKELQFCSHYAYTEARSHHCFSLHGQQVNDYCAVATCQMILCYYRYYYTQDQIAPALNYSAGGGCPSDQSNGYKKLTGNHLDSTFDASPTWEKARDQIDGLHPLKSGINGHARACAGYSSNLLASLSQKKLYIYDPWPWNADYKLAGTITWEDWNSLTHTNYVYTRLIYP